MDIRVINLERSTDRRQVAQRQLDALGLAARFSPAVDGKSLGADSYRNFLPRHNPLIRRPLTPGEIGCFASHYRLWQECIDADKPMLVLEDDFILEPKAIEVIDMLPQLLDRHRYVRLGGILPRSSRTITSLPGGRSVVRFDKGPQGTVAYALTPVAAATLLEHAATWREPVDNYIDSFWVHGLLPIGVVPYPVGFPRGGSLIEAVRFDRGRGIEKVTRKAVRTVQTVRRVAFTMSPAWRSA